MPRLLLSRTSPPLAQKGVGAIICPIETRERVRTGILGVFVLALTVELAQAGSQAEAAKPQPYDDPTVSTPTPESLAVDLLGPGREVSNRSRPTHLVSSGTDRDASCFTMRSYLVAREGRDSDSTHLVGYTTCEPASRVEFKTAIHTTRPGPER